MKITIVESTLEHGRLAIMVWYFEGQNEPSKPEKDLVYLPNDITKRDELITDIILADDLFGEGPSLIPKIEKASEYGDLVVSVGNTHLYFTFVELPTAKR